MGKVVISLDSELAWGFHDLKTLPTKRIKHAYKSWSKLLDLFDDFEISATWAIVGHLFLKECDGLHEDHPAGRDWFKRDPGGSFENNRDWFCPDLIKEIIDADVNHEIACHSFSHVPFVPSANKDVIEAELKFSIEAAKRMDKEFETFIYPRTTPKDGYKELLKKYDFKNYRGISPSSWYDKLLLENEKELPNYIKKFNIFIDRTFGISTPPMIQPRFDKYGLVNVPASISLGYLFRFAFVNPFLHKVKKGIAETANSDGYLHLYFHPNNLTKERDFERLKMILKYLNKMRNENSLEIKTIGEIGKIFRNSQYSSK